MTFDFSDQQRKRQKVGLTPLVDVIFILIVFFMLVSSFSNFKTLSILPATTGSSTVSKVLHLYLSADGRLLTKAKEAGDALLMSAQQNNIPLAIHVKEGVPLQTGVQVLDQLKAQGFENVSLVPER